MNKDEITLDVLLSKHKGETVNENSDLKKEGVEMEDISKSMDEYNRGILKDNHDEIDREMKREIIEESVTKKVEEDITYSHSRKDDIKKEGKERRKKEEDELKDLEEELFNSLNRIRNNGI